MNVDGEVSDAELENADDRLSFSTMSVSAPSQIIMYSTGSISNMNVSVVGNSYFNFVERAFETTDMLGGN
jgi:hypothetical protein